MLVREVRKITDRKVKILFEDGLSFVLYRNEAKKFGIREMEDVPDETIRIIMQEILVKRSRLRCLNLLRTSDRTEGQLAEKLRRDGYPEEMIDQALEYVASYHYTDDRRYARNYVRRMSDKMSRKQIEFELLKDGVDRDTIRAVLCEAYDQDPEREVETIRALAARRGLDPEHADREEMVRFFRYLAGKGFGGGTIRRALSESDPDPV